MAMTDAIQEDLQILGRTGRAGLRTLADAGVHALTWIRRCAERAAQRRALADLSDWQLRDLGLTRCDLDAEAAKWSWRE